MNHNGLAGLAGSLQVNREGRLLLLGQLRFIVVIQPGLTDGDSTRMRQRVQQPVQVGMAAVFQVQRMHAHAAIDIRVRIGELLYSGCVIGVHTDAQKLADATRSGGIKQGIKGSVVGGQVQTIKVAVRVNQHNNYMVWVGRSDCSAPAR